MHRRKTSNRHTAGHRDLYPQNRRTVHIYRAHSCRTRARARKGRRLRMLLPGLWTSMSNRHKPGAHTHTHTHTYTYTHIHTPTHTFIAISILYLYLHTLPRCTSFPVSTTNPYSGHLCREEQHSYTPYTSVHVGRRHMWLHHITQGFHCMCAVEIRCLLTHGRLLQPDPAKTLAQHGVLR